MKDLARDLLQRHSILKGIAIIGKGGSLCLGEPLLTFSLSFDQRGETRKLTLRASPESFFQVNFGQNQALVRTVLQFGEVKADERVLDLYAGIGNLSLPLASGARWVTGVEENPAAVEDARLNSKANQIDGCDFVSGKTEEILKDWKREKPELLVLDPPRAGGKKTVGLVAGLGAKRIVYVSCDPATLSRDLALFAEAGFLLQRLCLIDLFPQTYHMEVAALLGRETG
jgi:23S rRNA (uracil1939-C5)-methyltransferase